MAMGLQVLLNKIVLYVVSLSFYVDISLQYLGNSCSVYWE